MLMYEPVGRGEVNCGKNLPSDVLNMTSSMVGVRGGYISARLKTFNGSVSNCREAPANDADWA